MHIDDLDSYMGVHQAIIWLKYAIYSIIKEANLQFSSFQINFPPNRHLNYRHLSLICLVRGTDTLESII
ncbi:hypothetical protein FGO68_gene4749 [Halteria grandinella]|uniref:Uncharacterized protein n=1 Tax=Halteria grandinella TaxID=5974 RepID=A0A8J8NQG4_HALGN|nr:hypothetical protein FGO68_gene4749 [Halteria grandinella]